MKILIVDDAIHPLAGGSAERTIRIGKSMIDHGHQVDLLTLKRNFDLLFAKKNDFNELYLLPSFKLKYLLPLRGSRYIDKIVKKYDIVHISKNWSLLAFYASVSAKRNKIPYIFSPMGFITIHNNKSRLAKYLFLNLFTNYILKNSSYCITVSNQEFKDCNLIIKDKNKIKQISNGFVAKDFLELPISNFRKKNNLTNKKIILALGRMDPIKGFHLLIEAFSNISQTAKDWQLVFIGPDNDYRNKLINRANELECKSSITFLDPHYGEEKRMAYYSCDLFVIPSLFDAMTIVAVEAAACGKPILITNTSDFPGLILNKGGIEVSPTIVDISKGITTLINDDQLRIELGTNGKKYVYENFEWTVLSKEYNNIFNSVKNLYIIS
jgi:glycosyltransferase involved in cell wall biosynthesis